jgi:hypothetical protein
MGYEVSHSSPTGTIPLEGNFQLVDHSDRKKVFFLSLRDLLGHSPPGDDPSVRDGILRIPSLQHPVIIVIQRLNKAARL